MDKRLRKSFIHRKFAMFKAKKSLGQNFLVNKGVLDKIVKAAELKKNNIVLEIGPGTGVLTEKLVQEAGRVIAVEKDRRLVEELKKKFSVEGGKNTNVEIVEGDILKFPIFNFQSILQFSNFQTITTRLSAIYRIT
ncbi:MAG: methyltransferase domain-containing protein [Candidatus Yanofskybacteria bacterium]|nr:methyltransferase domain-containing protein [Candidatus Yanofskybacteria bacterium]